MEYLAIFFKFIVEELSKWGYIGIGIGMALESGCIPLPSEIILPFAGYLVWQGKITFFEAFIAATVGTIVGSLVAYYIGKLGGRPFILKYGRYFFISHREFQKAEHWFNNHGESTIFFSRLLPVIRTFISLPAGIAEMNVRKFLLYSLLGATPWNLIFIYLGERLGKHWDYIYNNFHQLDYVIIAIIVLALLWYWRKVKTA